MVFGEGALVLSVLLGVLKSNEVPLLVFQLLTTSLSSEAFFRLKLRVNGCLILLNFHFDAKKIMAAIIS